MIGGIPNYVDVNAKILMYQNVAHTGNGLPSDLRLAISRLFRQILDGFTYNG